MVKQAPSLGRILTMVLFALSCFGLLLFLWLTFGGPTPLKPKGYRVTFPFKEAGQLAQRGRRPDLRRAASARSSRSRPTRQGRSRRRARDRAKYAPLPAGRAGHPARQVAARRELPRADAGHQDGRRRRRRRHAAGRQRRPIGRARRDLPLVRRRVPAPRSRPGSSSSRSPAPGAGARSARPSPSSARSSRSRRSCCASWTATRGLQRPDPQHRRHLRRAQRAPGPAAQPVATRTRSSRRPPRATSSSPTTFVALPTFQLESRALLRRLDSSRTSPTR